MNSKQLMPIDRLHEAVLRRMMGDMEAQDNRCTSHPMYEVQRWCEETKRWYTVTTFFTNKGAELYIENHGHGSEPFRIYISSGWDNYEWRAIRALLLGARRDS